MKTERWTLFKLLRNSLGYTSPRKGVSLGDYVPPIFCAQCLQGHNCTKSQIQEVMASGVWSRSELHGISQVTTILGADNAREDGPNIAFTPRLPLHLIQTPVHGIPGTSVILQKCSHPQILNSYTPNSEHTLLAQCSVLRSSHIFFDFNNIFGPLTPPLSPKLLVPSYLQVLSHHAWSLVFLWLHLSALSTSVFISRLQSAEENDTTVEICATKTQSLA